MDPSRRVIGGGVRFLVASLGVLLALTVPASRATPWTGSEPVPTNLVLYLHNASTGIPVGAMTPLDVISTVSDTQRPWAGTGGLSVSRHYDALSFVVAPQLAANLTLNGTLTARLYANESGSSPNGGSIVVTVALVTPSGGVTVLGAGPPNPTSPLGPGGSLARPIALSGPSLHRTVAAGDTLMVNVTVNGNAAEGYGLWWGQFGRSLYPSSVTLPSSSYLAVPSITVRDPSGAVVTGVSDGAGNRTVTVTALVTDPLGVYDFETHPVDLTVASFSGARIVSGREMSLLTPSLSGSAQYTVALNYSALPAGRYQLTVNATDNTNHGFWGQDTLPAHYGRAASAGTTLSVLASPPNAGGTGSGSGADVAISWVWIGVAIVAVAALGLIVRRRRRRDAPAAGPAATPGSSAPVAEVGPTFPPGPAADPKPVVRAGAGVPVPDRAPGRSEPALAAQDGAAPIRLVDRARVLAANAGRLRSREGTKADRGTPPQTTSDQT